MDVVPLLPSAGWTLAKAMQLSDYDAVFGPPSAQAVALSSDRESVTFISLEMKVEGGGDASFSSGEEPPEMPVS